MHVFIKNVLLHRNDNTDTFLTNEGFTLTLKALEVDNIDFEIMIYLVGKWAVKKIDFEQQLKFWL